MLMRYAWLAIVAAVAAGPAGAAGGIPDLAILRPDVQTGIANAGWKYDRYKDLASLDAGTAMTVADLKGPAVITHIHTTRHQPVAAMARGIVLEIWFDAADEPAVCVPLADFFGDGCNGGGMDFTSTFIECAPWSYNAYFPMPFKERARVVLRNDTGRNAMNYSYVEWRSLPEWDDRLGYFHATYQRKCFRLTREADETFFEVRGSGHLLGRQFSIATDEPAYAKFRCVMEGNNEVDVDGRPRALDYLGTEDSFTFSWGFQRPFAGLRAGMTLVDLATPSRLSIYRFHDHMPIRFRNSLAWRINWQHETGSFAAMKKAAEGGGAWVDYAAVFYWYQDAPGGYRHAPLEPLADRQKTVLRPAEASQVPAAKPPADKAPPDEAPAGR